MAYQAKGFLHEIFDTQQVSEKFSKREFVLEIQDGRYPQHIKFQLVQDKCDLVEPYRIGQEVEVTFDLRGRAHEKNGQKTYYTTLDAWRIQAQGNAPAAGGQRPAAPSQGQTRVAAQPIASDDDADLPF